MHFTIKLIGIKKKKFAVDSKYYSILHFWARTADKDIQTFCNEILFEYISYHVHQANKSKFSNPIIVNYNSKLVLLNRSEINRFSNLESFASGPGRNF